MLLAPRAPDHWSGERASPRSTGRSRAVCRIVDGFILGPRVAVVQEHVAAIM